MKKVKCSFSVLCSVILTAFLCLSVNINAASSNLLSGFSSCCRLFAADGHMYIVEIDGTLARLKCIDNKEVDIKLEFKDNIYSYTYCAGTFYFCRSRYADNKNSILVSGISAADYSGFYKTVVLDNVTLSDENTIAFDKSGNIYLVDINDSNTIIKYSSGGVLLSSFDCGASVFQLFENEGSIYAVCDGKLLEILNDKVINCGFSFGEPALVKPLQNGLICDGAGKIYTCKNSSVSIVFDAVLTIGKKIKSASADNNLAAFAVDDKILVYDIKSKQLLKTLLYSCDDMAVLNSRLYIIRHSTNNEELTVFEYDELTAGSDDEGGKITQHPQTGTTQSSAQFEVKQSCTVTSAEYAVDNNNATISGIKSGTTVAQFKKKLSYSCNFSLYYKGKLRTSGNVGTGMTAVFTNGNEKAEYFLVVSGDCTGEGNVNSRDKNMIFSYLLGENNSLGGVYFAAADLNSDFVIDTKDLLLAAKAASAAG